MRSIEGAVAWAKAMDGKAAPGGPGHCQELTRMAYGLPGWAPSALEAWKKIPAGHKHPGGDPLAAPAGAMCYFDYSPYGHAVLSLGDGKCLSNDYCTRGLCCIAPLNLPHWSGAKHWLGYSFWTPYGVASDTPK